MQRSWGRSEPCGLQGRKAVVWVEQGDQRPVGAGQMCADEQGQSGQVRGTVGWMIRVLSGFEQGGAMT